MATPALSAVLASMAAGVGGAARLLPLPRALSRTSTGFVSTWAPSKMALDRLTLGRKKSSISLPARKLVVRAARTDSKGVSLGFRAPSFELPEPLTGKVWKLDDFEAYPALLVMFICNHCPFVKHLKKDVVTLSSFYMKKGLAVVAISSNSIATHPQDGPEFMAEDAKTFNYPFPYLYDKSQEVARDFGAVCTPEFFLFKKDGRRPFELVYHGQFDDSRPSNNVPVTGRFGPMVADFIRGPEPGNRFCSQWPASPISSEAQHQMASWGKVITSDRWPYYPDLPVFIFFPEEKA